MSRIINIRSNSYALHQTMPEYSFILAGRLGVGKSSLFTRLQHGKFLEYDKTSTRQFDTGLENFVHPTTVDGKEVKVTLWDTGGLERYDSMTANYYRYCHAVLLVYDLSAEETLFFLADWFKEAKANSRWPQRIIFSLWGNKSDISPDEQSVKEESISAFLKQYNIPESLNFRVSAKSGDSVKQAFQKVVETVHDDFSTQSLLDLSTERDLALLNPSIGSRSGLPPKRLKCCGR